MTPIFDKRYIVRRNAPSRGSGRIIDMVDYIRTWWLLNQLSKRAILMNAMSRTLYGSSLTPQGQRVHAFKAEEFLNERADKYCFGILKYFKGKYREIRIEKDLLLLQRMNAKNLIELADTPAYGLVINILPEGYFFSSPTNGLEGFLREFKYVTPAVFGLFALEKLFILYRNDLIVWMSHLIH